MTEKVKALAINKGADLVGVAGVERFEEAPKRLRPEAHLPEASCVISIAVRHPRASVERGYEPPADSIMSYLWYQEVMNRRLAYIAFDVSRYLEDLGYLALPMPPTNLWRYRPYKDIETPFTADFSHRHAAVAAGLGEFGWNGLLLTPQYGPRQRLVSVITNAPLKPDPLYRGSPLCDKCLECVKACPMSAFSEKEKISIEIEGKAFEYAKHDKLRCAWSEHYGLVGEEGPKYFGSNTDVKPPKDVTEQEILSALGKKDRFQWHDGVMGKCLKVCLPPHLRKK